MSGFRLAARDGFELAADWFEAASPRGAVVIASAMGVPRRIYSPFADHLARRGLTTLCFDYRGTGQSRPKTLRGFPAALGDWATLDLAAALAAAGARVPGLPLGFVGHSVGGQLLGLTDEKRRVSAALFFAAQSGYWRHWAGRCRMRMWLLWHVMIPGLVPLFGYLPMRRMLGGEDVPAGVGREWAAWGRHPLYVLRSPLARGGAAFAEVAAPIRSRAVLDDTDFAPLAAVDALLGFYTGAARERVVIDPAALGGRRIGHFGWLKAEHRDGIWRPAADWLLDRLAIEPLAARG